MFKATLRVPTAEPYSYIEITDDFADLASVLERYNEATRAVKVGVGLENGDWNACVDRYLKGEGMDVEHMEKMNAAQLWFIHQIDKSRNRTKPKEKKTYKIEK